MSLITEKKFTGDQRGEESHGLMFWVCPVGAKEKFAVSLQV
jgi:hypothetical protein